MKTVTVKNNADIARLIPDLLHFTPVNSIVMLCVGGPVQFHARVDTPGDTPHAPEDFAQLSEVLLSPALRHSVTEVILAIYDGELSYLEHLAGLFTGAGIAVVAMLQIDTDGARTMITTHEGVESIAVAHKGTREQIAEDLKPRGTHIPVWAEDRDPWYIALTRENAAEKIQDLKDELPICDPMDELTGHLAAMLSLGAWLAGDGALAWIAYDIGIQIVPQSSVLQVVKIALETAMPPEMWERAKGEIVTLGEQ